MADINSCVVGTSWKLRSGQPQMVCGCLCDRSTSYYIMQTFGVERREVKNYKATTQLLESNDFIGLNPDAEFESASYNASTYLTADGEIIFTGQEQKLPEYINESLMPGVESFEFS